ncbi:MAG: PAS-domain containing protein, partial [Paracoccaceae bacterium]|nr:PAS-domain containing protein [Paracoccaceae bacterium]
TRTFFAVNITAPVHAERAQRSFVQTLTKTFAQLSTGLAIFDRDRQLVLFNPALIELTQLSGEFLSARPTLTSFFDWLREARVMPEPRDYAEWRQKLTELTKAATEGTFSELWSLPNGLSYRVFGRPHPDGAIAFLFEDVTAELSLTRNFINESEINNALLDTLPEAIIVFSPSGEVLSTNSAYSRLMGEGHNTQIRSMEVSQVVKMWAREHGPSKHWDKIEKVLTNPADTKSCSGTVERKNETGIGYRISPLAKCAVAIVFWHCASSVHRSVPEDILA